MKHLLLEYFNGLSSSVNLIKTAIHLFCFSSSDSCFACSSPETLCVLLNLLCFNFHRKNGILFNTFPIVHRCKNVLFFLLDSAIKTNQNLSKGLILILKVDVYFHCDCNFTDGNVAVYKMPCWFLGSSFSPFNGSDFAWTNRFPEILVSVKC